jgi:hypothetical protein
MRPHRLALIIATVLLPLQASAQDLVPVNIDAFVRAETDRYFKERVDRGCFGILCHDRQPVPIDGQTIIRMNRDTPYSGGVFDLTTPLTLVKPVTGGRFQSIVVINEDHYIQKVIYDPGTYVLTQDDIGTRYVQLVARTFMNPNDPADIEAMHKAQDGLVVTQDSAGTFAVPNWDRAQLDGLRKAILSMSPWVPDSRGMFGSRDQVDPVRHLIGTAGGYGGNREQDAIYLNVVPEQNDGTTPFVLTVKDVPMDGFWSVIVYNKDGFFEAPSETISVNNVTAKPEADGSVVLHFGGDTSAQNYLRIMPGWSYMVRLYRPRAEIINGSWVFPKAQPTG